MIASTDATLYVLRLPWGGYWLTTLAATEANCYAQAKPFCQNPDDDDYERELKAGGYRCVQVRIVEQDERRNRKANTSGEVVARRLGNSSQKAHQAEATLTLSGYNLNYRRRRAGERTYTWIKVEIGKQWHRLGRWDSQEISPEEVLSAIERLKAELQT